MYIMKLCYYFFIHCSLFKLLLLFFIRSPREGCDFGPIQSDSEFETKRMEGEERPGSEETSQSQWKWGDLPTSSSFEDKKQECK